jgi:DNA-binding NarL/FixJ family response regulator
MRILIADDNALVRRGIASLLSGENELEVCGEAADANETLRKADELRPSLILLDVSMPGMNGLNTARLLKENFPELKILIISQHDSKQLLPRSLEVGANGCIDKARLAVDLLPTLKNMLRINPL